MDRSNRQENMANRFKKRLDRLKKRRLGKRHPAEVLLCPISCMIDVVFLLLIYFVWTFQNTPVEAFAELNQASSTICITPAISRVEASVLPNGEYRFNNIAMPLDEIEGHLRRNSEAMDEVHLIVRVHPRALEGEFMGLLDRCHKHGIKKINVVTLKE